ncbi:UNVERIFIED_CONTAM: hypothetical protein K2H54_035930 [Gekko kuhli]
MPPPQVSGPKLYSFSPAESHPLGYQFDGTCNPIFSPPHLSIETKTAGGGAGRKQKKENPVWSNASFVKFNLQPPPSQPRGTARMVGGRGEGTPRDQVPI